MSYQSSRQYAQRYSRIKLENYQLVLQRALTSTNRYNNQCQIQETTGFGTNQTNPALSLDAGYQYLDGFTIDVTPQIVTAGLPADSSDIGGLRLVCQEAGTYKIDVAIRATNPSLLVNQCLIKGRNGTGFQNVAPVLGNPAYSILNLHPRTSTIPFPYNSTQFRLNAVTRLDAGEFVQVSFASPSGSGGALVLTIQTMTIHLTRINN